MFKSLMFVIAFICLPILFGCKKKETIYMPEYMEADVSFLNGSWEWKMTSTSVNNISPKRDFIYAVDSPENYCTLIFDGEGHLEINSSAGSNQEKLKLTGLTELGNLKVVSFRNVDDALFRFTFDSSKNTLSSENDLFSLILHQCNSGEKVIYSVYEKI